MWSTSNLRTYTKGREWPGVPAVYLHRPLQQKTWHLVFFRKHDRARINAQKERTYYLDGKAVCKNRHKRTGQDKTDSLEEFRKKHPSDVGRLTVKKSKRSYNRLDRIMPGAEFMYEGKRYILQSQQRCGTCWHAKGLPKSGVGAGKCRLVKYNRGLVYMNN